MLWKNNDPEFHTKTFHISFGFDCVDARSPSSIEGLFYNLSIYNQSNQTECIQLPEELRKLGCINDHEYMTLPTLVGEIDVDNMLGNAYTYQTIFAMVFSMMSLKSCYQHWKEFLCMTVIPVCETQLKVMVPPC